MNAEIQMRDAARADLAAAVEAHLAAGGTIRGMVRAGIDEPQDYISRLIHGADRLDDKALSEITTL